MGDLRPRTVLFLVLILTGTAFAQESLPLQLEQQIATGVEALKSGDRDSAEKIFSAALQQGVKHPLVFHNLGVIAQQRGDHNRAAARFRPRIRIGGRESAG